MSLTWTIALAVGWAVTVAGVGVALTEIGGWYYTLRKPRLQPPDWLFGPAWTLILGLAAASATLAFRAAPDDGTRALVVALFVANGALNVFWNVLFFTRRRPDHALVEVAVLWASILAPMVAFWSFSPAASLLLAPYLAWVSFASGINAAIVRLNGPFGAAAESAREVDRMRDA